MSEIVAILGILQWVGLAVSCYLLGVTILNLLTMPKLGQYRSQPGYPRVSILVPARNEEENLQQLMPSLLAQDYPDFEVLVLDDNSTDHTRDILTQFARSDSRLRVLAGLPRPRGWLGKNWACHQLSEIATGDWLLFTDADTIHRPGSLRAAMDAVLCHRLGFLTGIVHQEARTWAERLVVPFYSVYHVFCTVPFALGLRFRRLRLSAGNGQLLLFSREAYDRIGGYCEVRSDVLDDHALAMKVARLGLDWRFCDASRFVSCRMYDCWRGVVEGFSKSVFAAFGYRADTFLVACAIQLLIFFGPLAVLALAAWHVNPFEAPLAAACLAVVLSFWLAVNRRFRFPLYLVLLHPATVAIALLIGVRSMIVLAAGRATWKGRIIEGPAADGSAQMVRMISGLRTATYAYWSLGVGIALLTKVYYRMRQWGATQ
jgi:chlorobactene glucosyltransferase